MAELDLKALLDAASGASASELAVQVRKLSIELGLTQILLGGVLGRLPDVLEDPFMKAVYDTLALARETDAFTKALVALKPLLEAFEREHAGGTG